MSLAIPREATYSGLEFFNKKKIATSYPVIISKFFKEKNINVEIEQIGGSVEIAPGIGLADGIFDIVSTGSTLVMNGLQEVEVVAKSEAVIVANKSISPESQAILDRLLFRIDAVIKAKENKYLLMNAPNDKLDAICALLPGMRSPTIMPLAEKGWSGLHTVVKEDDFWEVIDQLKSRGAEGILVVPIEKMIL